MALNTDTMDDSLRIRERKKKSSTKSSTTTTGMSSSTSSRRTRSSSSRRRRSEGKDEKRRTVKEEPSSDDDTRSRNPLVANMQRWSSKDVEDSKSSSKSSRGRSNSHRGEKKLDGSNVKDHTRRRRRLSFSEDDTTTDDEMDEDNSQISKLGPLPAALTKDGILLQKAIKSTMMDDSLAVHQARRSTGGSGRHRGNNKIQQMRSKQKAAMGSYYKDHAVEDIEALEIRRREEQQNREHSTRKLRSSSQSKSHSNAPVVNMPINAHKEALLSLKLEHEEELVQQRIQAKSQPELQPLSREMSQRVDQLKKTVSSRTRSSSVPPELDLSTHKKALASLRAEHTDGIPTDPPKKKNKKKSSTRPRSGSRHAKEDSAKDLTKAEEKSRRGRSSSRAPKKTISAPGKDEDKKKSKKTALRKTRSHSIPSNLEASMHKEPVGVEAAPKKKKKSVKSKSTTDKRSKSKARRRDSRNSYSDTNSLNVKAATGVGEGSMSTHETISTATASHREDMMQQHSRMNKSWSTLGSLVSDLDDDVALRNEDVRKSEPPTSSRKQPRKCVRFSDSITTYQLEPLKQDPSTKWYSRKDLAMLLDHEMGIAVRALEESESDPTERRTKQKSLHCCWRGLEHIQRRQDKAEHITHHVLSVLVIHYDLQKQVREGKEFGKSPAEMLRAQSKNLTRDDRKLAYKYGLQDAKEARGTANDRLDAVMETVQKEHGRHNRKRSASKSRRKDHSGASFIERSVRGVRRSLMNHSMQEIGYSEEFSGVKARQSSGSKSERGPRSTVVEAVSMLRNPMENTQLIMGTLRNS